MRAFEFSRCALSTSVAAALLAACGGSAVPLRTAGSATDNASPLTRSKTFEYTGKEQTFVVPAGATRLTVSARGGEGAGGAAPPSEAYPGFPGRVYAIIRVHSREKLYIFVGGSGSHGGFNGGGAGGTSGYGSGRGDSGGGASDVRSGGDTLKDRIIVAAGGGGSGSETYAYGYAWGGNGGGLAGKSGGADTGSNSGGGGAGGTQHRGGAGGPAGVGSKSRGDGRPGHNGELGSGGNGGNGGAGTAYDYGAPGGGGGGGYHGGGGGGGGGNAGEREFGRAQGGGGGGGSSYVESSAIKHRMWTGWRTTGDGRVVFSWN